MNYADPYANVLTSAIRMCDGWYTVTKPCICTMLMCISIDHISILGCGGGQWACKSISPWSINNQLNGYLLLKHHALVTGYSY